MTEITTVARKLVATPKYELNRARKTIECINAHKRVDTWIFWVLEYNHQPLFLKTTIKVLRLSGSVCPTVVEFEVLVMNKTATQRWGMGCTRHFLGIYQHKFLHRVDIKVQLGQLLLCPPPSPRRIITDFLVYSVKSFQKM